MKVVEGHKYEAGFTDDKSDIIASSDISGRISLWNLQAALPEEATPAKINTLT